MLVIDDVNIHQLHPMSDCVEAMEVAFRDYGISGAVNIPRIRYQSATSHPEAIYSSNIHIGTTPSYDTAAVRIGGGVRPAGAKSLGRAQKDPNRKSWGFICLINMSTGEPLALISEFLLSGIRVGATNAVAAKYLTRTDVSTVGMFGSGKIARTTLEALLLVRPIERVKVFSPTKEHREQYAKEMSSKFDIEVVAVEQPRDAMTDVDIVSCITNAGYVSGKPVFDGSWLQEGQFVIAVQNTDPNFFKTEVDDTTIMRSKLIVINDKESVFWNKQQELLGPIDRGVISWDDIETLGNIVAAGKPRTELKAQDIVWYKNSTGMGIQMAAAGAKIYQRALNNGVGVEVSADGLMGDGSGVAHTREFSW